MLASLLRPFFLDPYSLSMSFLGCNALCIVINFLVLWSICQSSSILNFKNGSEYLLWPRKGSLIKTQTRILDNRLYYTRKIELHRKGKKSHTVRITPILICPLAAKPLVLVRARKVHYGDMGKTPTTVSYMKNNSGV